MDLRELGYFVAVYEEKSVTAAARRCFISQPSVSAALASLEHELAAKLFVRHRKGATPTEAAARLYPRARRLVDDAAAVKASFRVERPAAPVRVGLMRSLDVARTRELIAAMARDRELALHVVGADAPCDVRIVSRTLAGKHEAFVPLWSERFVVALPAAHPLAARASLRSTELAGEKQIQRCHCEYARHLARGKRASQVVAVAQSEEWAVALVAAGLGIAIIPEGTVAPDAQVAIRPLADVRVSREVGLAYRRRAPLAAHVERLIASARQRFRS
jgi:DNA-binding transcriptional LysR family regulator